MHERAQSQEEVMRIAASEESVLIKGLGKCNIPHGF